MATFCWVHFIKRTLILGQKSTLEWSSDSAGALFNAIIPTDWGICYYLKVLFLDTPLAYFLITWFGSTALCTARTTRWRRRGRSLTLRYFTRAILILIFSEILILHIPKFCYLVHWFQNYFWFCSATLLSHVGTFGQRPPILHWNYNGEFSTKIRFGVNFWLGGHIDSRSMGLSCMFHNVFRDSTLIHILLMWLGGRRHSGQRGQQGGEDQGGRRQ